MSDARPAKILTHELVRASAGTGKTYRLTQRYLDLLTQGAPINSILATTFTRKAAGEILGRVIQRLLTAHRQATTQDRAAQDRAWLQLSRVIEQLHRINISTIDSFFHRIATSFRFELGLPLNPRLLDEASAEAQALRLEAIEQVLDQTAGLGEASFKALQDLLRRLHHDAAVCSLTRGIDQIIVNHAAVFQEAPDGERWNKLTAHGLLDAAQLRENLTHWMELASKIPVTKTGGPRDKWLKSWQKVADAAAAGRWEGLETSGILAKIVAGENKFDGVEIEEPWLSLGGYFCRHIQGLQLERIVRQTAATHALLEQFLGRFTQLRVERGVMFYSDVTQRLASASLGAQVTDPLAVLDEIYFRLDGVVTHLLLDEFQDTSLDQFRVLQPFVDEITATSDGSRTLFVVGDTKQAIYGWRGGCAALFDNIEARLPADCVEHLARSWRSSQVVLDAVNAVFAQLTNCATLQSHPADLEAAQVWGKNWETHTTNRSELAGLVSFIESPLPAANDADGDDDFTSLDPADDVVSTSPPSTHERFAAQRIAALHGQTPHLSIGVLVRANDAANRLLFELRKLGVDASAEGGNPIAGSPAVSVILSALTLADHPGDKAAAFHVMNSPLAAVVDLRDPGHAAATAASIREALLRERYGPLLTRWVQALAPSCSREDVRVLMRLLELADQFDDGSQDLLRPGRFVDMIDASYVEENTAARVRVMTIHKSKGLEFDIVVLPDLDRRYKVSGDILVDRPQPSGPIEAVYRYANAATRAASPQLQEAYDQWRQRLREEDLSLLYVAMTRARQALHLIVKPGQTAEGKDRTIGLCPAGILRDTLGDPAASPQWGDPQWYGDHQFEPVEMEPTPAAAAPLRLHLKTPAKPRRHLPRVAPSSLHHIGPTRGRDVLATSDSAATQQGTIFHEKLALISYLAAADAPWPAELAGVPDTPALRQALIPKKEYASQQLWLERRFMVVLEGQLISGCFDRVVLGCDETGQVAAAHLVDYKSDAIAGKPSLLEARVARYRPQIKTYQQALMQMLQLDSSAVTTDLLFLQTGTVVAM